jgi:hypothetical protein
MKDADALVDDDELVENLLGKPLTWALFPHEWQTVTVGKSNSRPRYTFTQFEIRAIGK